MCLIGGGRVCHLDTVAQGRLAGRAQRAPRGALGAQRLFAEELPAARGPEAPWRVCPTEWRAQSTHSTGGRLGTVAQSLLPLGI